MTHRELREQNRRSWEAVVPAHHSHRPSVGQFLRAVGLTVFPEERVLLGELQDRTLLHLMCNTGQDTLSFVALGAQTTGVDISGEAISRARALSVESGISAHFEQADVYDWLESAKVDGRQFDRVFCSYGAICWLPDLEQWARGVAAVLAPHGRFAMVEFHPISNMFDRNWQLVRDYPANGRILEIEGVGDYVGESGQGLTPGGWNEGVQQFVNTERAHLFQWGVGEVVTALAQAGLRIEALHEYTFINGERPFATMRELPNHRLAAPDGMPQIPLMYGIAATKVQSSEFKQRE